MKRGGASVASKLERVRGWFWEDLQSGGSAGSYSIGFVESGRELHDVAQVARESQRYFSQLGPRDADDPIETAVIWRLKKYVTLISLDSSLIRRFGMLLARVSKALGARICAFESTGHDVMSWKSLVLLDGIPVTRFSMCPDYEIDAVPPSSGIPRDEDAPLTMEELDHLAQHTEEVSESWSKALAAVEEDRIVARRVWMRSDQYRKLVANFFDLDERIVLDHLDQFSDMALAKLPKATSKGKTWRTALSPHEQDWFSRGHPFGWMDLPRHAGLEDVDLFPGVWSICKSSSIPENDLIEHGICGPVHLE